MTETLLTVQLTRISPDLQKLKAGPILRIIAFLEKVPSYREVLLS